MWTFIFICVFLQTYSSSVSIAKLIPNPAALVLNVAKFAFSIYTHIEEKNSASKEKEEIIQTLSNKIESASESLYTKLLINLQFNKIEETQLDVNSRMIDLKNCLTAKQSEVDGYKRIFVANAYQAVAKVRYLSKHLLEQIPGSGKNIIQMVSDTSRCNRTAMDTMANESLDLMSDGMLIEMTSLRMSDNFSFEIEKTFWGNELKIVMAGFQQEYNSCSAKEREMALEDLRNGGDLTVLHNNNKQRYQWPWNDIFLIDNGIPDVFGYYQVDEKKILINKGSDKTKIVTYKRTENSLSGFTAKTLSQIITERIKTGRDDADNIAAKVKSAMNEKNVRHSAVIVYFNGAKYQPSKVIDPGSQAIWADTDKRYIDYCTSFWCPINWDNWLGVEETEHGYFTVYVVLDNSVSTPSHSFVSDTAANTESSLCLLSALFFLFIEF
ncbi:uncharacterized protein LOC127840923 isoform X2 [Dreissena polymorpha]|uniref:Uncharacterized protein n=1 Tax=Dreissena polymorpha TaxID=45954 RepID=A0A9D4IVX2_DREPO|nr:uncharacterized protein LOC127840923 isoform X2 [Dreissena polymorpha]KAH3786123.1 hypothetical protein DPMN_164225 [Dreissena polymorpha]